MGFFPQVRKKHEGPRLKRGIKSTKRGLSKDEVVVVVTLDRKSGAVMCIAMLGRIGKADIANAISNRIKERSTIYAVTPIIVLKVLPRTLKYSSTSSIFSKENK